MKKVGKYHAVAYVSLVLFVLLMFCVAWFNIPLRSTFVNGLKDLFKMGFIGSGKFKLVMGLGFFVLTLVYLVFLVVIIVRAAKKKEAKKGWCGGLLLTLAYVVFFVLFFIAYGSLGKTINGSNNIIKTTFINGINSLFKSSASVSDHMMGVAMLLIFVTGVLYAVLEIVAYFKTLKLIENGEPKEELAEGEEYVMSEEEMRQIIREELVAFYGERQPEPVEEIKEEEPVVTEEVVEKEEEAPVEVVEEVKEEPVQEAQPEPVVEAVKEEPLPELNPADLDLNGRVSFFERILVVEPELLDIYNELKNEIMSYGVKSRVSSTGDCFRLHRVTYMKMVFSGKKVKIYLHLDPKDYKDSTIPFDDASSKKSFEDIPFVFKVKSGLSIRRAKELIKTMMNNAGISQQHEPEHVDYAHNLIKEVREEKGI